MKIGVISDTHDQIRPILKAIKIFNKEKVEMAIHCGDWVSPFAAARFSALKCPIKGVFGNCDGDKEHLRERSRFIEFHEEKIELEAGGKKLFATHGHNRMLLDAALKSGNYDAVFSGHSHTAHIKKEGKTLWLNPGTLVEETNPDVKGMSIAVYDTGSNTARIIRL